MAALLQTPEYLQSTKAWYQQRLAGVDTSTVEGKRARLAFLATEGAFLLRYFGLMDIDEIMSGKRFLAISILNWLQ